MCEACEGVCTKVLGWVRGCIYEGVREGCKNIRGYKGCIRVSLRMYKSEKKVYKGNHNSARLSPVYVSDACEGVCTKVLGRMRGCTYEGVGGGCKNIRGYRGCIRGYVRG